MIQRKYQFKDIAIILFFSKTAITNLLGYSSINKSLIAYGILAVTYMFLGLSFISKNEKGALHFDGIAVIAAVGAAFFLTYRNHPEYHKVFFERSDWAIFSNVFNFVSAPFAYYFIRCQKNINKLKDDFLIIAYLNFFGNCLGFMSSSNSAVSGNGESYNMLFGYQMALPAILFLWFFLSDRKKTHYLILSIIGIAEGVFFGSRGCILGYACFLIIYMLFIEKGFTKYKAATIVISAFGAYALISSRFKLFIYNMMIKFDIHSRTLKSLVEGDLTNDNGRDRIYEILRSSLEKAGLFRGYGVYGDRYLLDATFYSHSLIYEILISFGIFFGVILLLLMFSALLCAFIKFRKKQNFGLLLAISSFTICHLLFSYSLWYEQMFGAMIGLLVTFLTSKEYWDFSEKQAISIKISEEDSEEILNIFGVTE